MSGVELKEVRKSFGNAEVIHSVDLSVDAGEFVVFVGPSGCGKSTLLRLIAGLEDATAGSILIGGRDVTRVDPAERGIAMVFQSYALYPHMTVEENMGFGLRMTGTDRAVVAERVRKAASILHLDQLLKRKPKQLSGGQRQRVAIGRAIVREPQVFLFDEPLSNLDAELRVQMRLEIAKLHKDLGVTMIYVTHDQVEAMTLADKIVVLRSGRVEQVGSPLQLYHDPDNVFVAGFIGSPKMNFLRAKVIGRGNGKIRVSLPDFDGAEVPVALRGDAPAAGTELSLGVRPEHFDPAGAVRLKTRIDVIENLGGASYAYARAEQEQPLTIELRDAGDLAEGGVIETGFDPDDAFLFDPATGRRIR
ncbi:MAG: ABC transporter ATP-binding protein [Rhizobiales bacterium 65-79]|jgi:lactose/L-arabinose transport system ATP-binding protein|nr:sn-glycerol-3-phosphate ABC transporter ATP-binding protein UgpC [Hyphomicrobiales bacterium]OJU04669.1 MAG: ABC transporter ATP-binding protein [Rhizobiales bacterium 65-79]